MNEVRVVTGVVDVRRVNKKERKKERRKQTNKTRNETNKTSRNKPTRNKLLPQNTILIRI
jgi:hypothetical protein